MTCSYCGGTVEWSVCTACQAHNGHAQRPVQELDDPNEDTQPDLHIILV